MSERKIKIDSDLVNKIIPNDFFNIDFEEKEVSLQNKNDNKRLKFSQGEIELDKTKNNQSNYQNQLKELKLNSLWILRQVRERFNEKQYYDYQERINNACSLREIKKIEKEYLLNAFPKKKRQN
ncbi:MAG: hypothetical protein mread185_000281 [Mycoplasmataceae bacterium]|nr:MAG: hypothetical protein mread185_000281 [Mycoplasmataceae bacterium]